MRQIKDIYGDQVKISVNVTGLTIQLDEYESFLREMWERYPEHVGNIMIEITGRQACRSTMRFWQGWRGSKRWDTGWRLMIFPWVILR